MTLRFVALAAMLPGLAMLKAQPADSVPVNVLGAVDVIGVKPKAGIGRIDDEFMRTHKADRLDRALDLLPGVTVRDAGMRNEGKIFVRGFDQTRVPVYIDGVPVSIPYEGQLDARRLLTAGLEGVHVQKVMPSMMLSGNPMGGAINLVTSRPRNRLVVKGQVATAWDADLSVGSRFANGKLYVQANAAVLSRDYIRLPHSFKLIPGLQTTRHLDNSDTRDWQFGAKAGYTPNATDEYAVTYTGVRAKKGVPVYLGQSGKPRFWRYPRWDKDEVLLNTSSRIAGRGDLMTRLYYDKYYNELRAYDDATYTTQQAKSSFTSIYDDYTVGAFIGWQQRWAQTLNLRGGANWRRDVHRSHNVGEPVARQADDIYNIAAEALLTPSPLWELTAGVGLYGRKGTDAQSYENKALVDYPVTNDADFNYQASGKYRFATRHAVKLSFARTSRFPTLSERYTHKFGKSIPNPDLQTEHAYNLDLTVEGRWSDFKWSVSGFYSFINNAIMEITALDPDNPTVWQLQNKGRAQFRGIEVALAQALPGNVTLTANYTYINRVNRTDPAVKFTDVPASKLVVTADWEIGWGFAVNADMSACSRALSTSDGTLHAPGFALFNVNASKSLWHRQISLRGGISNVFDRLYNFTEGYPQQGRVFYAAVAFNFTRR